MRLVFPAPLERPLRDEGPEDSSTSATVLADSDRVSRSVLKRSIDIALSFQLLTFLLPFFIVIAIAIKVSSPGPVFFRQERYGRLRRKFWVVKFRTMRVMESDGPFEQAARDDDRVTTVGRWLRRSSMDELPQLFNVLSGSMSLVGPRPHAVAMDDYYGQLLPGHGLRHLVKPGLTGLAQVSGFRGPTQRIETMAARVEHDIAYIRDWSITADIRILLRTPMVLFGPQVF